MPGYAVMVRLLLFVLVKIDAAVPNASWRALSQEQAAARARAVARDTPDERRALMVARLAFFAVGLAAAVAVALGYWWPAIIFVGYWAAGAAYVLIRGVFAYLRFRRSPAS